MSKEISPEEYLKKSFDYSKLTKNQLRKIMYENGVESIPPLAAKKSELLDAYRSNIHDRIDVLSKKGGISTDNPFQKTSSKKKTNNIFEKVPSTPTGMKAQTATKGETVAGRARVSISGTPSKERVRAVEISTPDRSRSHANNQKEKREDLMSARRMKKLNNEDSSLNSYAMDSSSQLDHSNIDFDSSSLASSSFLNLPENKQSSDKISKSGLRKKAFTSDPTLDKMSDVSDSGSLVSIPAKAMKSVSKPGEIYISAKKRKSRKMYLLGIPILCIIAYFRFLCPYCRNGEFFCVLPPEHSKIVDGNLVCEKDFIIKRGILKTYCVRDDRREREVERETKQIKKMLEKKNGDFSYGIVSTRMVSLKSLTRDSEVMEKLKKENGVIIAGDMAYSVNKRVSVRTFVRYYAKRILMGVIPLVLILVTAKLFQSFSRKRRERMLTARKIVKDVIDVLVRQIYISAKNANFPSHVYVEQLKDCFGVDKGVWKEVESVILKNSNVREIQVTEKKAWEWVGPILYKPEFNGSLL